MKTLQVLGIFLFFEGIISAVWIVTGLDYAYKTPLLLYVHLFALGVAIVGILLADKTALAWIGGKKTTIEKATLNKIHYIVSTSLALLVITGSWLFWPMHEYLLRNPYFLLKMGFVLLLVCNAVVIENLMTVATTIPFAAVPLSRKLLLALSGGVSFICWVGAAGVAYFIFGWLF